MNKLLTSIGLVLIFTGMAMAHDLHLKDSEIGTWHQVSLQPTEYGYIIGVDDDGDGKADRHFLIYKDGDLNHYELHIKEMKGE